MDARALSTIKTRALGVVNAGLIVLSHCENLLKMRL